MSRFVFFGGGEGRGGEGRGGEGRGGEGRGGEGRGGGGVVWFPFGIQLGFPFGGGFVWGFCLVPRRVPLWVFFVPQPRGYVSTPRLSGRVPEILDLCRVTIYE